MAIAGIGIKYWKGTGWLVTRDQGGLWRPNASIVPQGFVALAAICECCSSRQALQPLTLLLIVSLPYYRANL